MSKKIKATNPFYVLLVVVGTLFAVTACAYGVMTVRMIRAQEMSAGDRFFDTYGLSLMIGEVAALAVLTVAAIGTDNFWTRRAETKHEQSLQDGERGASAP